ncbi:hypothetical protein BGZ47_008532, partial [Haplosporangium gracile]
MIRGCAAIQHWKILDHESQQSIMTTSVSAALVRLLSNSNSATSAPVSTNSSRHPVAAVKRDLTSPLDPALQETGSADSAAAALKEYVPQFLVGLTNVLQQGLSGNIT